VAAEENERWRRRNVLEFAVLTFVLHALTASSGLFWLDSGDFVTASFDLGVPHPTGFPLYVLLGKLFCFIPIGSASFRMSLFSAATAGLLSALAIGILYELLPRASRTATVAASALTVLALWCTDIAALMGRVPDVYAIHAALTAGTVLLCLRIHRTASPGRLLTLGFVLGLGVANHAEFRLYTVVFGLAALFCVLRQAPTQRLLSALGAGLTMMGSALIGLLPYLYLPAAAAREPYHLWARTDTLGGFWDHVWGLSIRLGFGDSFLSTRWIRLRVHFDELATQVWEDFGLLLILVAAGLLVCRRSARFGLLLLLSLAAIDAAFAAFINPMGLVDDQNGATLVTVFAILAGVGLCGISSAIATRTRIGAGIVTVGALAVAVIGADAQRVVHTGIWGAEDLVFEALSDAPEGALVMTASDNLAAARLYLVGVGALRPDIQTFDRTEISNSELMARRSSTGPYPLANDDTVERWRNWGLGTSEETYQGRVSLLIRNAFRRGRVVLWEGGNQVDSRSRWEHIEPGFPLHQIVPAPIVGPLPGPDELLPTATPELLDPWHRRWLASSMIYLGALYFRRGEIEFARQTFERAHQVRAESEASLVNLAVIEATQGDLDTAIELVREAVEHNPLNWTAHLNLARYHCLDGQTGEALRSLRHAEEVGGSRERIGEVRTFLQRCPPH
jgi:tetratricopeptide (TPR) repeat protein